MSLTLRYMYVPSYLTRSLTARWITIFRVVGATRLRCLRARAVTAVGRTLGWYYLVSYSFVPTLLSN